MPTTNLSPYFSEKAPPDRSSLRAYIQPPPLKTADAAGIGLAECWKILRTGWRLIAFLLISALTLTAIVVLFMTPQYTAIATVMINPESAQILDVSNLVQGIESRDVTDYDKTQYALLQSDQLAAQVIHDLELEKLPLFNEQGMVTSYVGQARLALNLLHGLVSHRPSTKGRLGVSPFAIDLYLSLLKVQPQVGTRLVDIAFKSPDPSLSARIVNAHVQDYVLLSQNVQARGGEAERLFLEKELVEINNKVQQAEAALNAYRDQAGILSFGIKDEDKNEIAEKGMEELTKALTEAQEQRIKAEAEMEEVKSGDYDSLPEVVNNLMVQNSKPEADRLEAEYAELSAKYTDGYPPLMEVKAKLVESRRRINREVASIAHAVERNYKAALGREQELERLVSNERRHDFAQNDASLKDAVLAREVDTNRELYQNVLKRMQEISVDKAAPLSNISVVEEAVPPPYPSNPKKLRSLALSGFLALIGGIAFVFLLDQLDDRLKSVEEIESYLQLPGLGMIPDFTKFSGSRPLRTFEGFLSASSNGNGKTATKDSDAVVSSRQSIDMRMEAYRSLRTALLYSRAGGAPKTILFVSALPAEGKSTTVSGTALAFAQTGAETLLIHADLRAPRRMRPEVKSSGLSEILVGQVEPKQAIRRLDNWRTEDYGGLYLISAGSAVPNPGELLTSKKMHKVLRELSNVYKFILLDSAPFIFASDSIGLATMVDAVVVVARSTTPKQAVRSVCRRLTAAGAKVYGVVLNGVDLSRSPYPDYTRYYAAYESHTGTST
jgi:succinoglycan biosynthesis transport protein ExoP